MKRSDWVLLTATGVLVIAAAVSTERALPTFRQLLGVPTPLRRISGWQRYVTGTPRIGSDSPRVTLIEFVDYQCPICQTFQPNVERLLATYPGELAVAIRFVRPADSVSLAAAMAALCADQQGHFEGLHRRLLSDPAVLRSGGWRGVARTYMVDAPSLDTVAIQSCVEGDWAADRIDTDTILSMTIGVDATPSFLIDGALYRGGSYRYRSIIDQVLGR